MAVGGITGAKRLDARPGLSGLGRGLVKPASSLAEERKRLIKISVKPLTPPTPDRSSFTKNTHTHRLVVT